VGLLDTPIKSGRKISIRETSGQGDAQFLRQAVPHGRINHSFYRMPTENVLLQWAKTVPEGFRFALKVNQQ